MQIGEAKEWLKYSPSALDSMKAENLENLKSKMNQSSESTSAVSIQILM